MTHKNNYIIIKLKFLRYLKFMCAILDYYTA
jgi:hypothetical protein